MIPPLRPLTQTKSVPSLLSERERRPLPPIKAYKRADLGATKISALQYICPHTGYRKDADDLDCFNVVTHIPTVLLATHPDLSTSEHYNHDEGCTTELGENFGQIFCSSPLSSTGQPNRPDGRAERISNLTASVKEKTLEAFLIRIHDEIKHRKQKFTTSATTTNTHETTLEEFLVRTHDQISSRKQKRQVVVRDQYTPKAQSRPESVTQTNARCQPRSSAPSTAATTDTHDINVGSSNSKSSSMLKEKFDFTKFEETKYTKKEKQMEEEIVGALPNSEGESLLRSGPHLSTNQTLQNNGTLHLHSATSESHRAQQIPASKPATNSKQRAADTEDKTVSKSGNSRATHITAEGRRRLFFYRVPPKANGMVPSYVPRKPM